MIGEAKFMNDMRGFDATDIKAYPKCDTENHKKILIEGEIRAFYCGGCCVRWIYEMKRAVSKETP